MLLAAALVALIYGFGAVLGRPLRERHLAALGLWLLVVGCHLLLPQGAMLRESFGGSVQSWLVLGGVLALILGYRAGLKALRARAIGAVSVAAPVAAVAAEAPAAPSGTSFSEAELQRYARHLMLRELGGAGQRQLKAARVLVVGAGGLGSPALLYLAAAGIGELVIVDDDQVEASNLQRQIIHAETRIGQAKTASAAQAIRALTPYVAVREVPQRLDEASGRSLVAEADLVLDGTDNFATRYLVNRLCVEAGKPLVAGAMTQWEGQLSLYHPARSGPCFQCVFPEAPAAGLAPSCAEAGVIAPLPGVIGSMMALEAVKYLGGAGESLRGRLVLFDGLYAESRVVALTARGDCPVCHGQGAA